MDFALFLKSALIGLSIAAPVGPIGVLCIQRVLAHGMRIGFVSGLGAAGADAIYGAVGAFGVSAVTQTFIKLTVPLSIGGAVVLGWMGFKLLRSRPAGTVAKTAAALSPVSAFSTVFGLTLTNPMTIFSFIAVFAAIGGSRAPAPDAAALMVLGVFMGSALWWLILASGVAALRQKIDLATMRWINAIAGTVLLGFAAWQLSGIVV